KQGCLSGRADRALGRHGAGGGSAWQLAPPATVFFVRAPLPGGARRAARGRRRTTGLPRPGGPGAAGRPGGTPGAAPASAGGGPPARPGRGRFGFVSAGIGTVV